MDLEKINIIKSREDREKQIKDNKQADRETMMREFSKGKNEAEGIAKMEKLLRNESVRIIHSGEKVTSSLWENGTAYYKEFTGNTFSPKSTSPKFFRPRTTSISSERTMSSDSIDEMSVKKSGAGT